MACASSRSSPACCSLCRVLTVVRIRLAGFPEPAWNQLAPGVLVALFPTRFGLIQSSGLYDLSAEGDDLGDELSQLTTDWNWCVRRARLTDGVAFS